MTPAQTANLVAESRRIIERHEAGEYMHPDTLAMARAETIKAEFNRIFDNPVTLAMARAALVGVA